MHLIVAPLCGMYDSYVLPSTVLFKKIRERRSPFPTYQEDEKEFELASSLLFSIHFHFANNPRKCRLQRFKNQGNHVHGDLKKYNANSQTADSRLGLFKKCGKIIFPFSGNGMKSATERKLTAKSRLPSAPPVAEKKLKRRDETPEEIGAPYGPPPVS